MAAMGPPPSRTPTKPSCLSSEEYTGEVWVELVSQYLRLSVTSDSHFRFNAERLTRLRNLFCIEQQLGDRLPQSFIWVQGSDEYEE